MCLRGQHEQQLLCPQRDRTTPEKSQPEVAQGGRPCLDSHLPCLAVFMTPEQTTAVILVMALIDFLIGI
jgi:hypothetical protein